MTRTAGSAHGRSVPIARSSREWDFIGKVSSKISGSSAAGRKRCDTRTESCF